MALPEDLRGVTGAQQLFEWFGYWPEFHDAEVISLLLNRRTPSILKVHTWHMTSDVDETGQYVQTKHVVVDFLIDISVADDALQLYGFSHQNAIFGLAVGKHESAYRLNIDPCYGLGGSIKADNVSIRFTPGKLEGQLPSQM